MPAGPPLDQAEIRFTAAALRYGRFVRQLRRKLRCLLNSSIRHCQQRRKHKVLQRLGLIVRFVNLALHRRGPLRTLSPGVNARGLDSAAARSAVQEGSTPVCGIAPQVLPGSVVRS